VHFSALSYGQMGIPLSRYTGVPTQYDAISPESAWHFQRYVSLYDEGGYLQNAQSMASAYPTEVARAKSTEHLGHAASALREWESAPGPLSRWSIMPHVLCDVMRGVLLELGELYPQEKWLWWWFSQRELPAVAAVQHSALAIAQEGPEAAGPVGAICALLEKAHGVAVDSERAENGQGQSVPGLWRDLWWQDNCLYHDIMRNDRVSAFVRTGRCLERIRSLCLILLEDSAKEAPVPLEGLKRFPPPLDSIGRHLECLSAITDYAKWRYQIGYVMEILRDALIEKGVLSTRVALKPWLPRQ